MSLRFGLPLAAAAIALSAGSAHAIFQLGNGQAVSLTLLLNPESDHKFQVGDKIFTINTYTSATIDPSVISVTGFIAGNPLAGIGFDLTGGFGDPPGNGITDFILQYSVEVEAGAYASGFRIVDTGLSFNGSATGDASYARVDESVFDFFGQPGQNLLGTRQVWVYGSGTPLPQSQDFQLLPGQGGYQKLEIAKDVQFFANGPNGSSSASFVRQSFSQIPTPGGTVLAGLAGLIVARRRR